MKKGILLLFIFISFSVSANAQKEVSEKKGTFSFSAEPLEKVITSLKQIYSVEFSYSDDVIPLQAGLTLSAEEVSLQWVLEHLKKEFSVTYVIIGRRVILSKEPLPLVQTIRGVVRDQNTLEAIPGATVLVPGIFPAVGAVSDAGGYFKIENVPVGRRDIVVSCTGYHLEKFKDVVLHTGKELVLEVKLQESLTQLGEVTVTGSRNEGEILSSISVAGARSFSVEETKRYAGSVGDPARMAANFAGVTGVKDESNGLIIRGNSPRGLLWRIEGIEVPNPNHFTTEGASGGVVSILSSNVLDNSGFHTSAFSAPYGNALSGVFDISLRNGNDEKREYSLQAGILGLEASAEGPLSAKSTSSYLVNYRYSTLSVLDRIGFDLNRADEFKNYQDLAFKLNFPRTPAGAFSFFGIGGLSRSRLNGSSTLDNNYSDVGIAGLTHKKLLRGGILIRNALSWSGTHISKYNELLRLQEGVFRLDENFSKSYVRASVTAVKSFSETFLLEGGAVYSRLFYNFFLKNQDSDNPLYEEIINFSEKGNAGIYQAFIHAEQNFNTRFKADYGVHFLQFGLTGDRSAEPRLHLRWMLSPSQTVTIGYGKHSRIENLQYYLARDHQKGGNEIQVNKNLGFTRARHFVAGYEKMLQPRLLFKAETYYQQLYNVPVQADPAVLYAAMNEDSGFITDTLFNSGKGRNYGLELSLEKSFAGHFYYLLNGSLFQSKFSLPDGKERNTPYNNNFNLHFLAGYEAETGSLGSGKVVGFNMGANYSGGAPYIPIDPEKSAEEGIQVYNMEKAYEVRLPAYFRFDLQLTFRTNRPAWATEWRLDVRNVTNHRNPAWYYYHTEENAVKLRKQFGLLPVISCRIDF